MSDQTILVSLPSGSRGPVALGAAHYSYGFAAEKFMRMLSAAGIKVQIVRNPERFKSPFYGERLGLSGVGHIHLIFRSTEDIRIIPGCYNIACFAWEFDRLKDNGLPEESILFDQVRMLRSCDEVWVPCEYSRGVLMRHGLSNVCVIPAPISVPPITRERPMDNFGSIAQFESIHLISRSSATEQDYRRVANLHTIPLGSRSNVRRAVERGQLFLTICNPYDQRKNLVTLIEGFLLATATNKDAVLVVKLVTSGIFSTPANYLYHQIRVLFGIPHCINEEKVIFFCGHLDDLEMSALYRSSNYYLCASVAEGQNLPLLESMAHGCLPVSVRNTAMADYLSEDNAVIVSERSFSGLLPKLAGYIAGVRLDINFADRFQVADAVYRALSLSESSKSALVSTSIETINRLYTPEQLLARMMQVLERRVHFSSIQRYLDAPASVSKVDDRLH